MNAPQEAKSVLSLGQRGFWPRAGVDSALSGTASPPRCQEASSEIAGGSGAGWPGGGPDGPPGACRAQGCLPRLEAAIAIAGTAAPVPERRSAAGKSLMRPPSPSRLACAVLVGVCAGALLGGLRVCLPLAAEEATAAADARYHETFDAMLADPTNTEKAYAFAEAAVAVGDLDGAIAALERILLVDPDRPDIKLRLGELYQRNGAPEIAQLYLAGEADIVGGLEGRAVPPEIRDRARALVERAERERAALAPHRFTGSVFLGGRYETNANAGPSSNNIRVFGFEGPFLDNKDTEQSDFSAVVSSDLHYAYDFGTQAGHALEADLSLFGSRYAEESEVNTWLADLEVGPRFYIGPVGQPVASLRPFGEASYVALDDDNYLTAFGGGLNARLYPLPNLLVETTGRVVAQNFDDTKDQPTASNQTGTYGTIRPGVTWLVLPQTFLSFDGLFGHNDADENFETFNEYGAGVTATQLFPVPFNWVTEQLWSVSVAGAYRRTVYDKPDPQVDPDHEQKDDRYDLSLSLSVPFTDHLNLNVIGLQTWNESNLPNDQFDNTSITVGASFSF